MLLSVNANQLNTIEINEVPEFLKQYTLVWRTWTAQHCDFGSQRAPGLALNDLPHVLLRHHGSLQSGQVISIALTGLVEVTFILYVFGEVVHC